MFSYFELNARYVLMSPQQLGEWTLEERYADLKAIAATVGTGARCVWVPTHASHLVVVGQE